MFAILIIAFTLRCFSAFRDYTKTPGLLTKTAKFLPPEESVHLQRTNASAQSQLEPLRFLSSPMILTASTDNTAKLWNAETEALRKPCIPDPLRFVILSDFRFPGLESFRNCYRCVRKYLLNNQTGLGFFIGPLENFLELIF